MDHVRAKHLKSAVPQCLHRADIQQFPSLVIQFEALVGMAQAVMRHQRANVRQFGLIAAQKLLARGHVVEQIANRDGCSGRPRNLIAAQQLSARNFDR